MAVEKRGLSEGEKTELEMMRRIREKRKVPLKRLSQDMNLSPKRAKELIQGLVNRGLARTRFKTFRGNIGDLELTREGVKYLEEQSAMKKRFEDDLGA